MGEPGKYVLLRNVQASSKAISKPKRKNKPLKKALESNKGQKKPKTPQIPKGNTAQQPRDGLNSKQRKIKQKALKKNPPQEANVNPAKSKKQKQQSGEPKNFQDDLTNRLKASRFRFINEQLYTQTGSEAAEVFNQDDSAFKTYHEGYRMQVEHWPINPLDRIIKSIKKLWVKLLHTYYSVLSRKQQIKFLNPISGQ